MIPGRILADRRAAWIAGVGLVALTLVGQFARLAEPDIGYMLYAAGRLLDGAKLYRDVVDINPPPIFAFNLPIVWIARVTHVSDIQLYRLVTVLVVAAVLLFVRRLLTHYLLPERPVERHYVLLLLTFVLLPLAREDLGQREHLVLALLLPYLAIVIARLERRSPPTGDAAIAGALAGLVVALKPPFALPLIASEAWCRWRSPDSRMRPTPEVSALAVVVCLYLVVVLTMTPDYLRLVGTLGQAYTTYLRVAPLNLILFAPGAPLTAFALLAAIALRGERRHDEARSVVSVAMVGCFLAGVAQQKGLRYHFYPSFALATLLLGLVATACSEGVTKSGRIYRRVASWAAMAVVIVTLGSAGLDLFGGSGSDRRLRAEFGTLLATVRMHARGEAIGVLSYHMGSAFPLINYAGVPFASRFPCLWILPASYWEALSGEAPIRYHEPAEMGAPERMLTRAVAEDLVRARPRLLLILRPFPDRRPYGFRRLNYVAYFGRDPMIAALLARYQRITGVGQYDIFERVDSDTTRVEAAPSPVVLPVREAASSERPPVIDGGLLAGLAIFVAIALASGVKTFLAWRGRYN